MGGKRALTVADFFCGAGGFSEGFRQMGFDVVFALDNWKPAIDTHNLNHPECKAVQMDILELDTPEKIDEVVPDVDIIIGSPPCVAFSGSNKAGKADKSLGIQLIEAYLRIIAWKKKKGSLKYWILENVPNSGNYMKAEYSWEELGLPGKGPKLVMKERNVLNAAEYGAPQTRKRFIGGDYLVPNKTHKEDKFVTMRHVLDSLTNPLAHGKKKISDPIYGFSIDSGWLSDHFYDSRAEKYEWERSRKMKEDHGFMGKMSFPEYLDRPSRTVMATMSASTRESIFFEALDAHNKHAGYRLPTIREIASFMSFPITYQFEAGSEGAKYRLVGNAVCPKFASALAGAILRKEGLAVPSKFIELPLRHPSFDLNGRKRKVKPPRPKPDYSKFESHVPYLKAKGMRVQLSNLSSDFKSGKIVWNCIIRYGQAKNHKLSKISKHDVERLMRLDEKLRLGKGGHFERFESEVKETFTKLPSAERLQKSYCENEEGWNPDIILNKIKTLVDKHYPANKFDSFMIDNSGKALNVEKSEIPLRIAAGAFACSYVAEMINKN